MAFPQRFICMNCSGILLLQGEGCGAEDAASLCSNTLAQCAEAVYVTRDGRSYSAAPRTSVSQALDYLLAFCNYPKDLDNQYKICFGPTVT